MGAREDLLAAVQAKDAARVAQLLEDDASLATSAPGGASAILAALYQRDQATLQALTKAEPALTLHEAAALGRVERVRELLHADPSLVTSVGSDGWTALHLAAHFGQVEAMRALLDEGADVAERSRNTMANQPLHAAVAGGSDHAVALLLSHGADANATQHGGWTPLQAAAQSGATKIVRLLLAGGALADAASDDGSTALSLARKGAHDDVVALLEEAKPTT